MATRERLICAAYELIYRHGFHAVGLDQIIKDAGVTKSTFYNHFESKDALIVAVLEWRESLWPHRMREALRKPRMAKRLAKRALAEHLPIAPGRTPPFTNIGERRNTRNEG